MSAELTTLVIRGYEKPEELSQQNKPVAEFQAMFNPENFSVANIFEYDDQQADGETGSEQKPKSIAPREFAFEFLIDGTGASGVKKDVDEEIVKFKKTTGFEGKERRPLYLSITMGTFTIRCVLKQMEVKYTLFRNDGKPVRGVISANFSEFKPPEQQIRENPSLASKLTRLLNTNPSDTLDLIAHKSYGDSDKLIELAKQNGLNSLKSVASGERFEIPPIDRLENQATSTATQAATTGIQQGISNLF